MAGGSEAHSLFVPWVNFLVYAGLLQLILRKPAARFFENRSNSVRSQVRMARDELEVARARYDEAKARYESRSEHADALKARLRDDARAKAEALVATAHDRAERLVQQAKERVEAEERDALSRVRQEAVDALVDAVTSSLVREHGNSQDKALRSRTIKTVAPIFGETLSRLDRDNQVAGA